ncbi:MAG TPA: hypothetical protein VLA13_09985 [Massilibacterium sp.]|nr:hypothetical protein [Massilibacterium sp.]
MKIGIDPGKTTGIALWNGKEIEFMDSMPFWDAIALLDRYEEIIPDATVYIENPMLNKPVFARGNKRVVREMIAQRVGMNKRDAQLIIEYCNRLGLNLKQVKPSTSKWSAKELKTITGIDKRTNEHVRDAIKLVYGR